MGEMGDIEFDHVHRIVAILENVRHDGVDGFAILTRVPSLRMGITSIWMKFNNKSTINV